MTCIQYKLLLERRNQCLWSIRAYDRSARAPDIITVQGPQSQRKSSSADAPLCKYIERRQCNLSSYCAALQPISRASCGGKCAQRWHFHGESRRVPASTHVIGCNNPRDEVARHKKCKMLVYCAAPQQICETRTRCKRAQISELVHDAHTLQLAILTPCTSAKRQRRAQNTVRQVA